MSLALVWLSIVTLSIMMMKTHGHSCMSIWYRRHGYHDEGGGAVLTIPVSAREQVPHSKASPHTYVSRSIAHSTCLCVYDWRDGGWVGGRGAHM